MFSVYEGFFKMQKQGIVGEVSFKYVNERLIANEKSRLRMAKANNSII